MADTRRNRRTRAASEARQAEVVRLYLTGHRIATIVRELGVSTRTVMRDLERARKTWKEQIGRTYDDLLPEYLERLQTLWQANWDGWRRSLQDTHTRSKSDTTGEKGSYETKTTTKSKSSGNPRYLSQLERILRTECELLGLLDKDGNTGNQDAPQVQEIVISSHAEYEEFKQTVSMEEFKKQAGKVG